MAIARRRAVFLLAVLFASSAAIGSPEQIASSASISCSATPFGQRLTLGLEQEYVVVHGDSGQAGTLSEVRENGLALWANSALATSSFATLASTRTTHVDLDGDGRDEWAVAGIKSTDAHAIVVTTFGIGPFGAPVQGVVWSWTAAANIVDLRIAVADVTGRSADSRQELVVAYLDAGGNVNVFVLNGTVASPTIQQASGTALGQWTKPGADGPITQLRLATGDVLLEGRDQIVLMADSQFDAQRVYYVLRYDDNTALHLSSTRYTETRSPQTAILPKSFDLRIGDLGGTPAAEMVVLDQGQALEGGPADLDLKVRYFTTTRDINNAIATIVFHAPGTLHYNVSMGNRASVVAAIGELDRRPGAELVLARQNPVDDNHLLVELYKVGFDVSGLPVSVGRYLSPVTPFAPIGANEEMFIASMDYLDVTIGQPRADGIDEVAVAVQDQKAQSDSTKVLKVRTFAMARPSPDPNANPIPTTFARTALYDYATAQSNTLSLHIDRLDYQGDSVLADIDASNCLRVVEPQLRSVVHLPPYWQLLQGTSGNFLATIGKTYTGGTTSDSTYGTFSSHDISAYVGVKVGGEVMGIGAEASAKVTAGYNYETSRAKTAGSDNSFTVGESQSQDHGEGLVVQEDDTYDCYTYNVHTLGITDLGSNVRSCELIRYAPDGQTELRGFTASDLVTWDTESAYNLGVGLPAQWVPLAPDWASVALFRQPTVNFGALIVDVAKVTDGQFATGLVSPAMAHPYVQIDLGNAKALTNVRVFPAAGHRADLDGFSLYVSASPFANDAPPSGPGVTVFSPDPASDNGFDHWNVWLRNPATQAPLVGRFLRLQSSGAESKTLAIGEIEAFADVHIEPPQYPVAVCDTVAADGLFTALMYDTISAAYRKVDVRGDLLWKGTTGTDNRCGTDVGGIQHVDIWNTVTIGNSGISNWDLANTSGQTVGTTTSISHSTRVGAELDVEAGAVVKAQVGGAYEFTTGVTTDESTTMYWEAGLEYAGQVGGFQFLRNDCNYRAQPFAYTTSERSNIGYEHQYTAVDYFVPDFNWNRAGPNYPPTTCYAVPPDRFFSNGFE